MAASSAGGLGADAGFVFHSRSRYTAVFEPFFFVSTVRCEKECREMKKGQLTAGGEGGRWRRE